MLLYYHLYSYGTGFEPTLFPQLLHEDQQLLNCLAREPNIQTRIEPLRHQSLKLRPSLGEPRQGTRKLWFRAPLSDLEECYKGGFKVWDPEDEALLQTKSLTDKRQTVVWYGANSVQSKVL